MRLNNFRENIYSQCGQDGVIGKAFDILGIHTGYCVEFGAWDGQYLSNSRRWLETPRFGGCLMEGDSGRFQQLKQLYAHRQDIHTLNCMVSMQGELSLDNLLTKVEAPKDFDLLSIDIDSDDYHIWNSLQRFRPKLVLIETNPYIPFYVEYVQKPELGRYPSGASVVSMYRLGISKGYRAISYVGHDWLFVREDLFEHFDLDDQSCIGLFLEGSEIRGHGHLPHGEIVPMQTGPACTRPLDVHRFFNKAIQAEFGPDLTDHFRVLTSPGDFDGLI